MLCNKCNGGMYIANIGHCSGCGSMTSSGMFTLCDPCSQARNKCAHCGCDLDADAGDDDSSDVGGNSASKSQLSFIAVVNVEHYVGEATDTSRDALQARNEAAISAVKADIAALVAARGWSADAIEVVNELKFLATLVLVCSQEAADALATLPGIGGVSPNGTVKAI